MTPDTTDPLHLKTLEKGNKAPSSRLDNAFHAHEIFMKLREAAKPRLHRAQIFQGMFDGNAPYNQAKRRNSAQAWQSNFNTLEGAARKDSAKVPYYDLFSSTQLVANCNTEISTDKVDAQKASRIRSEEFHRLVKSWPGFNQQMWRMLDDFIAFNKGFLYFEKPDSWQHKCIPWHKVYFPDGTGTDPEEWELFAIEHNYPVHKLYNWVKDEANAKAAGWNPAQVFKAIKRAVPKDIGDFDDPMAVQREFKSGELYMGIKSSTVQAASIFVREFDGSWSVMTVAIESEQKESTGKPTSRAEMDADEKKPKLGKGDYLRFKKKAGESIYNILVPFVMEVNDGAINAMEGLAKRIFSVMQAKDRIRNAQVDNVLMSSNIILRAPNGGSTAKTGVFTLNGGVGVIPPGWEPQQSSIFGRIDTTLAVNNDLDRMLDVNTGTYRPQFEKPQGNPESATAAQIRYSQSTVLTNSAVNRFYEQLDILFHEMFRRAVMKHPTMDGNPKAIKMALEFQKRLKDRGLSEKQIQDAKPGLITAMRGIGNGSQLMRQQTISSLGVLAPSLGPRGLKNWQKAYTAAYGGEQMVDALFPPEDEMNIPTQDEWAASQENSDASQGSPVLFAEWQGHVEHATSHITAGMGAIQAAQQGASPGGAYTFLQIMLPHIAQHIGAVGDETKRKQLEQAFGQLQQGAKIVEQAVQQMMQQQEQQNQLTFDQNLKMQEMQAKAQNMEMKSRHGAMLKERQQSVNERLNDMKTAAEIRRATAKTESEIVLAQRKAQQQPSQSNNE